MNQQKKFPLVQIEIRNDGVHFHIFIDRIELDKSPYTNLEGSMQAIINNLTENGHLLE